MTTAAGDVAGVVPPEMLRDVLESAPSLSALVRNVVQPIQAERQAIRELLLDGGHITPLPDEPPLYSVGAADGAYVASPLAIGDHLCTLAVAVKGGRAEADVDITGHRAWSDFQPHTAAGEDLAKAVMMTDELTLLAGFDSDVVTVIDGSHITHLISIIYALGNTPEPALTPLMERAETLIEASDHVAKAANVVACPKSDSSTALWAYCASHLSLRGHGLPDKVLASLVLNSGEVLANEKPSPAWERLNYTQGRATGQPRALVDRLRQSASAMRSEGIRVFHAKPHGASLALRIETKATADEFDLADQIAALCNDCEPPHIQEPLVQYLADIFAKSVSTGADVQLETARLDMAEAGETDYLEHLLRYYRTSI